MTKHPRIVLIHATTVAMAPIKEAAEKIWPEVEALNLLEEGLSVDRTKSVDLTPHLSCRIEALAHYAEGLDADGILFTCSSFGSAIEGVARDASIPILKPNEAMFDAAFDHGSRIALIYTFEPAAAGMEAEFREEAAKRGSSAQISSVFCDDALAALRAGDAEKHDQLIAETAASIEGADAILLAQFSMASAAPLCRQRTTTPVLTSPEAAITKLKEAIGAEIVPC